MNTYNFNDASFKNTNSYQNFINANPSEGYLKIRASAASGALPISGLRIVVSKMIDNNNIIFFEGVTDASGVIERITLPAPKLDPNNLDAPRSATYEVKATYEPNNLNEIYRINIYENIYVIQTINVVPTLNVIAGENTWL